jgi:hypothetical protein
MKLKHRIQSLLEKSLIERTMQYIKDRTTESFDDYFPCKRKEKCNLFTIKNFIKEQIQKKYITIFLILEKFHLNTSRDITSYFK